jgi:hypothetical protein
MRGINEDSKLELRKMVGGILWRIRLREAEMMKKRKQIFWNWNKRSRKTLILGPMKVLPLERATGKQDLRGEPGL